MDLIKKKGGSAVLTALRETDFETYAPLVWPLALDLTRSGYPTYTDGIKTKEMFLDRARRAFSRENEEILLYRQKGRVCGWIHYYRLPPDRYIGTCSFCIAQGMGEAVKEFIAFARRRFPRDSLYLGFPKENTDALGVLKAGGWPCIEESCNNVMRLEAYEPAPDDPDIVPVTEKNCAQFRALHDRQPEMYWNTDRLLADLDSWTILLCRRGEAAAGAVYFRKDDRLPEIFGVDFPGAYDPTVCRKLVAAALNAAKRAGSEAMVIFGDEESQADLLRLGFRCVGRYVCHRIDL